MGNGRCAVALVSAAALAGLLAAGCGRGPTAESDADRFIKKYDASAAADAKGPVAALGVARGTEIVAITVSTAAGSVKVFLAPQGVLIGKGLNLKEGDEVEVKGARGVIGGEQGIVAAEVRKAGVSYRLRDDAGNPV